MKTSDLIGPALDGAVARCEGWGCYPFDQRSRLPKHYTPSTDWAQGGPIIEREVILFSPASNKRIMAYLRRTGTEGVVGFGATHLIAAMRCYVASKLGDEVEIPEELK